VLALALLLVAQPLAPAAATTDSGPDIVYYGGRRVVFLARSEEVVLLDSAWVRYRGMEVLADSIHYDVKLHRLSAAGDVLFTSASENIDGALLVYDIDTRKGMMRTARTEVENGFFAAREVWLVEERVLDARWGSFTTCDHEHPHYSFVGPRVKLYMDDAAYAQPVLFKVGRAPVLAAPFWIVPVADKRKSGLLPFKFGFAQDQGWYAKNLSYYLVVNDYSDVTFYGDIMTKKGIQGRAEAVYDISPFARGGVTASYIREWDTGRRRYSIIGDHTSSRFLFGTALSAKVDVMSDTSYVPEYTENQLEWLKQETSSFASLSRQFSGVGRLTATVERYEDLIRHYRWTDLPRASVSFGTRPIVAGWTVSPGASGSWRLTDYSDTARSDTARRDERKAGVSFGFSSPQYSLGGLGTLTVSDNLSGSENLTLWKGAVKTHLRPITNSLNAYASQRVAGAFDLNQSVTMSHDENLLDTLDVLAGYSGSVGARTTLYRVYGTEALGMHGFLHAASPSVNLSYTPKVARGGPFGRPDFGSPDLAALNLRLENSFQAKFDSARVKRDLGRVDFSTGYDLVGGRFSPLATSFQVRPLQDPNLNLSLDGGFGFDLESLRFRRDFSLTTAAAYNGLRVDSVHKWERGFGLTLRHTVTQTDHMVTATADFAWAGWKLSVTDFGYNFRQRQLANYGLRLWRDLHCWEAFATVQRLGAGFTYDFELRIKKLPDIRLGKATFGSILPR
jgi:hypothetical protein